MGIVALVVGKAQAQIGVDRVESTILKRVGAQLVGEADPPSFLPQIEKDSPARRADQPQRFLQLRSAIALERAEHIACEAFTMEADQRRLPPERTDEKRDVILPIVGTAKGENLRFRHIAQRQAGAGQQGYVRSERLAAQIAEVD